MRLEPGDSFGRYTVEGLLGEGGMGSVYRAVDTKLERRVALKLLRPDRSSDASARTRGAERLLREARAAATIDHVNAVAIHDVGEVGETRYIAMELVVGRSLRTYVGDASVPIATRVKWLVEVGRALDAAHARGLVHRDVKPENVMVREDGAVKVLDFGIASLKSLERTDGTPSSAWGPAEIDEWRATLTRDGVLVGTPRYMSPEQLSGDAVDGRADQFALGVMAYELLTGVPPWPGDTVSFSALLDVLDREPVPLRRIAPQIVPALEEVVHRALQKKTEDRFPSMSAMVHALEAAQSVHPLRGSRRGVALAGLIAALAVGTGAVYASRPRAVSIRHEVRTGSDPAYEPPYFVLWLDAAKGITRSGDGGDGVLRWADQSGNGNDAIATSIPPVFAPNAIHGLPAVHFDGGSLLTIADSASLRLADSVFTVEIVARHNREAPPPDGITGYTLTTGYGILYGKTAEPTPYEGFALMVNYPQPTASTKLGAQTSYHRYVTSTTEGLNDFAAHVFGAHRAAGGTLEVRLDGVAEASIEGATDDLSAPGRRAFIGAQPTDTGPIQQLRGDIAEIMVVRSNLTPQQIEKLEAHLKAKYGI